MNKNTQNEVVEETEPPVKVLKKRGRKPFGKVLDINTIENKNITSSLDPEKECLIIHLPINMKDIDKVNNPNKLEKIGELSEEPDLNSNIFINMDNKKNSRELLINSELGPRDVNSELQFTDTSENK